MQSSVSSLRRYAGEDQFEWKIREARRVGRRRLHVAVVDPVGRGDPQALPRHQHRAGGDVVREHAALVDHVEHPQDVRVRVGHLHGLRGRPGHVLALVLVALVPVGHAVHVEAHDLAAVGDDVDLVPVHRRRAADAQVLPVRHLAGAELRHVELPDEVARLLVETVDRRAVPLEARVARGVVVRADEDPPAGDRGVPVALGAELGDPLDVLGRGNIHLVRAGLEVPGREVAREPGDRRGHVPRLAATPRGPVLDA